MGVDEEEFSVEYKRVRGNGADRGIIEIKFGLKNFLEEKIDNMFITIEELPVLINSLQKFLKFLQELKIPEWMTKKMF